MTKKPITYMGLVKVSLKKLIADGVDRKEAFRQTAKRWQSIKQGSDSEYSHDTSKQPSTRKSKKSKKHKNKHKNKHHASDYDDEDHDKQCKPVKKKRGKHCNTGKQCKKTKKFKNFDIIMKCIRENCSCKECHDKVEEVLCSHECTSC